MARTKARSEVMVFAALALLGLIFAFAVQLILLMGECLPHDGGAAMRGCEIAKQREIGLFPLLELLTLLSAVWLESRRSIFGRVLAASSGIVAAFVLYLIEAI